MRNLISIRLPLLFLGVLICLSCLYIGQNKDIDATIFYFKQALVKASYFSGY